MSDVDSVSSLPAALDAGKRVLATKLNNQTLSRSLSPRAASPPLTAARKDVLKKADIVEDGNQPSSPKADSEAETIIQSGRESLSPEKRRKPIHHEPGRRGSAHSGAVAVGSAEHELSPNGSPIRKRKRLDDHFQINNGRDSRPWSQTKPLRPPYPSATSSVVKIEKIEPPLPSSNNNHGSSRSSPTASKGDESSGTKKRSLTETVEDYDGDDSCQVRSQHSSVAPPRNREQREVDSVPLTRPSSNERSVSPASRPCHKRTASGPPHIAGDVHKKRKAPPPFMTGLQRQGSEDRQSASSSTSSSPLPSARLRKLAAADGSTALPAKLLIPKKQRDQNGRTRLARACAAQETEVAMARYAERPEDLNVADNAGNTPLQIASLEGCTPIVEFLLASGCEVNTKNIDKDTPLIDAVENGHVEVVKLLLDAGANPRTVNAEGDEPYELVPSDMETYDEIRRVLADAKADPKSKRRSEERSGYREMSSRRASVASPRESPVLGMRSPPAVGAVPKRKTVRSEATRNDLLWTKATPENLRDFAAKGDIAGVANILNVGQRADPESLIAAAKGGHDEVLSLLLGMGDADPDPDPVQGGVQKAGYNTPMLAAIGRGNLEVIKLLLSQPGFNPTRRLYRDRTYFELSRERKGEDWEDECDLLGDAYDNYIKTKKSRRQDLSSPRRSRDKEKETRRPARRRSSSVTRPRKAVESPSTSYRRESTWKDLGSKEHRRNGAIHAKERPGTNRSRSGNLHNEDSPESPRRKARNGELSSTARGEEAPKRRRLIAGRPPHDRNKRRASLPSSEPLYEREEGITKPRVNGTSEAVPAKSALKRTRSSVSPETSRRSRLEPERSVDELQKKRRRMLSEDVVPGVANGATWNTDDLFEEEPVSQSDQKDNYDSADFGRKFANNLASPQGRELFDHKALNGIRVKQEREKHDAEGLSDIPMEEVKKQKKKKKTETGTEERRCEVAEKTEEPSLTDARNTEKRRIAEEKQAAMEAEQARIAKEDAEQVARHVHEKAEEDERKRKEVEQKRIKQVEDGRQKRLKQERFRLERQRKDQEEQERRRRDALPNRLRVAANLVSSNDPTAKSHVWLKKFMPVVTAQTKQLDPHCDPELADEKWVPNFLVAPLLATNDLQLRQYASWEKRNATATQRMNLWRVTRRILVQTDDVGFISSSLGEVMQKDSETRPKYFEMDHVFWVRLSDFMDIVPHVPHLHGLDIQYLKMHIDFEPPYGSSAFELPQPDGNVFGGRMLLEGNDGVSAKPDGLINGYDHERPSTYV